MGLARGETTQVRFVVVIPNGETVPAQVFCAMSSDGWPPGGRPLKRLADGLHVASWELPVGQTLEYKFTRDGAWTSVEKGPAGEELANRRLEVRGDVAAQVVFHVVSRWADREPTETLSAELSGGGSAPGAAQRPSTLSGDIRTLHRVYSPQLGNERSVLVYLPPGYDLDLKQRYPTLYLHDGNNVFDAATSFAGVEWGADETAQRLIAEGRLRKLIIVAIYNNADRTNEYTPFADAERGGGKGDAYLEFIAETLKPLIDRTFRTRPGRDDTAIAGSSLGGLISLYAAVTRPDVFGAAAALSPALQWADGRIQACVEECALERPLRLWLDVDVPEQDAAPADAPPAARGLSKPRETGRAIRRALAAKQPAAKLHLHYEELENGKHHESAWADRLDRVLLFLFGADQGKVAN